MMLSAGFAMNRCVKYTVRLVSNLKVMVSIQLISSYQHLCITLGQYLTKRSRHADHLLKLDWHDKLLARAHQGLKPRLKGVARKVAKVLVGALCLGVALPVEAHSLQTNELKVLADKQLTDKQYKCHNSIVYKESRFNKSAINGSHYGYYQMRTKAVKDKPYDVQFYIYWYYVTSRYGVTKYDEPNYCNALHHLKTRGWQ